jgi:hypothetical protein
MCFTGRAEKVKSHPTKGPLQNSPSPSEPEPTSEERAASRKFGPQLSQNREKSSSAIQQSGFSSPGIEARYETLICIPVKIWLRGMAMQ